MKDTVLHMTTKQKWRPSGEDDGGRQLAKEEAEGKAEGGSSRQQGYN